MPILRGQGKRPPEPAGARDARSVHPTDGTVSVMAIFQQLSHSYHRTSKHGSESSQEILDSFQRNGVIQAVTLQPIISSAC
jgi:hypothetical protein